MVSHWLRCLVRIFLSFHLLVLSLSVPAAEADTDIDSGVLLHASLKVTEPNIAPAVSLVNLDKRVINLEYQQQVTLLHFWASWCLPCQKELPLIKKLRQNYQNKSAFRIITIAADSHKNIDQYVRKNNPNLPILIDQYGKALRDFQVEGLPGSYLIDKQGKLRYLASGAVDWDSVKVKDKIDGLLLE